MRSCWASKYSSCKGKISGEHLVSKGVFEQKNIFVQGFSWCKEEKEVGINNITANILCEKHNNGFSQIDQAGINAIKTIESLLPSHIRSTDTSNAKKYIDGYNFERWLLKTAINLCVNQDLHIGKNMTDSQVGLPSAYLLAVLFGELDLTHKMGLYFLFPKEEYKFKAGSISMYPVIKDKIIGAFVFHIRGLDFVLSLVPGHELPSLKSLGNQRPMEDYGSVTEVSPQYRCRTVNTKHRKHEIKQIYFKW